MILNANLRKTKERYSSLRVDNDPSTGMEEITGDILDVLSELDLERAWREDKKRCRWFVLDNEGCFTCLGLDSVESIKVHEVFLVRSAQSQLHFLLLNQGGEQCLLGLSHHGQLGGKIQEHLLLCRFRFGIDSLGWTKFYSWFNIARPIMLALDLFERRERERWFREGEEDLSNNLS